MAAGRKPQIKVDDELIKKVEILAGFGLTYEKIGLFYGVKTITWEVYTKKYPKIKEAMERGRAKAESAVSQTAYQMAVSGKQPSMTMFWLRCRARWKVADTLEYTPEEEYPSLDLCETSPQS